MGISVLLTTDTVIASAFIDVFKQFKLSPVVFNDENNFFSFIANTSPEFICFDSCICQKNSEQVMMGFRSARDDLKYTGSITFKSLKMQGFQKQNFLDIFLERPSVNGISAFKDEVEKLDKKIKQLRVLEPLIKVRSDYDLIYSELDKLKKHFNYTDEQLIKLIQNSLRFSNFFFIREYINLIFARPNIRSYCLKAVLELDKKYEAANFILQKKNLINKDNISFFEPLLIHAFKNFQVDSQRHIDTFIYFLKIPGGSVELRETICERLVEKNTEQIHNALLTEVMSLDIDLSYTIIDSIIIQSDQSFLSGFIDYLADAFQVSIPFNPISGKLKYQNQISEFKEHMINLLPNAQLLVIFSILQKYGACYYSLFIDYFQKGDVNFKVRFLKLMAHLQDKEPLGWVIDILEKEFNPHVINAIFYYMKFKGDQRVVLPVTDFLKNIINYDDILITKVCSALNNTDERAVMLILGAMKSIHHSLWDECIEVLKTLLKNNEAVCKILIDFVKNPILYTEQIKKVGQEKKKNKLNISPKMVQALKCIKIISDHRLPDLIEKTLTFGNNIQRKTLASNIKMMGRNSGILRDIIPLTEMISSDDQEVHKILIRESKRFSDESTLIFRIRERIILLLTSEKVPDIINFAIDNLISANKNISTEYLLTIAENCNDERYTSFFTDLFVHSDEKIQIAIIRIFKNIIFSEGRDFLRTNFCGFSRILKLESLKCFENSYEVKTARFLVNYLQQASIEELPLCLKIIKQYRFAQNRSLAIGYLKYPSNIRNAALDLLLSSFKDQTDFLSSGFYNYFITLLFSNESLERLIAMNAVDLAGTNMDYLIDRMVLNECPKLNEIAFCYLSEKNSEKAFKTILKANTSLNGFFETLAAKAAEKSAKEVKTSFLIDNFPLKTGKMRKLFIKALLQKMNAFEFKHLLEKFPGFSKEEVNIVREYFADNDVEKFITLFLAPKKRGKKLEYDFVYKTIYFCGILGLEKFLGNLQKLLKSNEKELFESILLAIGNIKCSRSSNILIANFSPMEKNFFSVIVKGLINQGNENYIAPLIYKSKSMNSDFRQTIFRVLRAYGMHNLLFLTKDSGDPREMETALIIKKMMNSIKNINIFNCRASL